MHKTNCGAESRTSMTRRDFIRISAVGARIEEAWWFYDGAKFREEIAPKQNANSDRKELEVSGLTMRYE